MDNRSSVLVVDDDDAILSMIQDTLKDQYEVCTASDVLEAADLLRDQNFDLLVLDLNMPVVDGEELMQIFSVHPNFNALPILVISAYPDLIERVKKSRVPVQAILPKPFSVEELRRMVAQTIARTNPPRPAAAPSA